MFMKVSIIYPYLKTRTKAHDFNYKYYFHLEIIIAYLGKETIHPAS